jgi:hypothetical protein
MDNNPILRYSDAELDEFREIIETKLRRATKHLTELQEQIQVLYLFFFIISISFYYPINIFFFKKK